MYSGKREIVIRLPFHIFFETESKLEEHAISRRVQDQVFVRDSLVGRYVTMLPSEKMYFSLVEELNDDTWDFLERIHDFHYLLHFKPESALVSRMSVNQDVKSMIDSDDNRYLINRGFGELFLYATAGRRTMNRSLLLVDAQLDGEQEKLSYLIDFKRKGIVSSRIQALIGKNGTGKSRSLAVIGESDEISSGFRKLISIDVSGLRRRASKPNWVSVSLSGVRTFRIASALKQLLSDRERKFFFDPISILSNCFFKHLGCRSVEVTLISGERLDIRDVRSSMEINPNAEVHFIGPNGGFKLSQGQRYMVRLIVTLLIHLEENSLILMDEPEVYLHPNLTVELVAILETVLKRTNSFAVVSTHSIFFVRELPKTSVTLLARNEVAIGWVKPESETFGASLDQLAKSFFQDYETEKRYESFVRGLENKKNLKIEELPLHLASKVRARA